MLCTSSFTSLSGAGSPASATHEETQNPVGIHTHTNTVCLYGSVTSRGTLIRSASVFMYSECADIMTAGSRRCIVVSTLAEACFYADHGFDDILYAYSVPFDKVLSPHTVALSQFSFTHKPCCMKNSIWQVKVKLRTKATVLCTVVSFVLVPFVSCPLRQ